MKCDALMCTDNTKNGTETDVDCGGACPPCVPGQLCQVAGDCTSRNCAGGACSPPSCSDGIKNGSELGVDCGGNCFPCGLMQPVAYPVDGGSPRDIVAADFNGDGKIDLAVCNYDTHDVSVLLGNGNGSFQLPHAFALGVGGYRLRAAEVSGDTNLDLIVHTDPDPLGNTVQILIGNGDGTFGSPVPVNAGNLGDRTLAFGDLDGDGKLDLAMGENGRISLRWGNGDTTFRPGAVSFCPGGYVNSLAVADFTGDGRPDLAAQVATTAPSATVLVLVQQADGGFPAADCAADGGDAVLQQVLDGPPGVDGLRALDVSSDGWPDLVGATGTFVALAFGRGDGGFVGGPQVGGGCALRDVLTGDVNKDSGTDLIGACQGAPTATVGVSLGQGSTFSSVVPYPSDGGTGEAIATGDFDRDGRIDVALVDSSSGRVLIFLNRF
jgi:hypothetical protein